ncbi:T9SS type A sorting domain-containing protein, partial [candidate division WOR-3 bacterium]|nr:T9SS type A sorting domain-containing protein [candidate division WOR-3 bacterium]
TTNIDWPGNGVEGYSYLAAGDVVLWRYEGDIWYARRAGGEWTRPVNLSNTDDLSNYPQGVAFYEGIDYRLLAVWTEQSGNDYYLVRKVITMPDAFPHSGGPQGADVQLAMPFAFEKILQNPARGTIGIRFTSPDARRVRIGIYDVMGRFVREVFDGPAVLGVNEHSISVAQLAAGVYFVRLEAEGYTKIGKVILLQ